MKENPDKKIATFFQGRDTAFELFQALRSVMERNCSPEIRVSKTQIAFGEDYTYLWVWLPQIWIHKRPEGSITLTIVSGEKLSNKRITESVQPQKGYWTHHILIDTKNDIDRDIEELIKTSYSFYLKRKALKERKVNAQKKAKQSKRYPFIAEHRGGPLTAENHRKLMKWARECSGHVLSLIDREPDSRLIEALDVSKEWENNRRSTGEAMKASLMAHAMAREATDPVLKAIARSVGQTLATAHMADHSLGGAFYALKAVKLAHGNVEEEKEWQNKRLAELPKELVEIVQTMWKKKELHKRI
ncbi:MAG: putative immunity protein [Bacteroidia bacterium]